MIARRADVIGKRAAPRANARRARLVFLCLWAFVAVGVLPAGCGVSLPRLREDLLKGRFPAIPEGAARVLSWRGERGPLFTYWGRQHVRVSVRAFLPGGAQKAEDGYWAVDARNAEGKRLPFLGFLKYRVNENGTRLPFLTPPVDLEAMPDGLYTGLRVELEVRSGRLRRIAPMALVFEIRGHVFKPFRVKIPLIPGRVSDVTPMPKPLPKPVEGTAVPFGREGGD